MEQIKGETDGYFGNWQDRPAVEPDFTWLKERDKEKEKGEREQA